MCPKKKKNKRSLSILTSLNDSPRNKGNKEQVLSGKLGTNLDCQWDWAAKGTAVMLMFQFPLRENIWKHIAVKFQSNMLEQGLRGWRLSGVSDGTYCCGCGCCDRGCQVLEHFNPLCQPLLAGRGAAGAMEQSAELPKVLPKLRYF